MRKGRAFARSSPMCDVKWPCAIYWKAVWLLVKSRFYSVFQSPVLFIVLSSIGLVMRRSPIVRHLRKPDLEEVISSTSLRNVANVMCRRVC